MPKSKKKKFDGSKKTRYMSRKRKEELRNREIAKKAFKEHKEKKKKLAQLRTRCKRKDHTEIMNMISQFMCASKFVREPVEWKSQSYNLERQIISFIKHVYCKYPVPSFMFEIFFNNNKNVYPVYANVNNIRNQIRQNHSFVDERKYFDWFLTIAGGGSFAKKTKGTLTKKEAHIFLNAPKNNTIKENLWYARCKAEGLNETMTMACIKRFFNDHNVTFGTEFWNDFIRLLKREEKRANLAIVSDVVDFLRSKHRENPQWSLKGRTLQSLIKHSNYWHRLMQMKRFGDQNLRWSGIDIPDWSWKEHKKSKTVWRVTQLLSSKELFAEGRKMRHCVASYGYRCVDGMSFIFTLTSGLEGFQQDEKHCTIEINKNKKLIQARSRLNGSVKNIASNVLLKWMSAHNIKYEKYQLGGRMDVLR